MESQADDPVGCSSLEVGVACACCTASGELWLLPEDSCIHRRKELSFTSCSWTSSITRMEKPVNWVQYVSIGSHSTWCAVRNERHMLSEMWMQCAIQGLETTPELELWLSRSTAPMQSTLLHPAEGHRPGVSLRLAKRSESPLQSERTEVQSRRSRCGRAWACRTGSASRVRRRPPSRHLLRAASNGPAPSNSDKISGAVLLAKNMQWGHLKSVLSPETRL